MQLRTGLFSRIGYKVKKVFWVGTLGLTSLTPAACRYRYSCTEIIRKAPPKKISICTSRDGKTVIIGKGKQQIVFTSFENRYRIDKEIDDIKRLYKLISEVNTLIPSMPLQKVTVVSRDQIKKLIEEHRDPCQAGYSESHKITISLTPNYEEILLHEIGHAVFRVLLGGKVGTPESAFSKKDEDWQKIYLLSFAHNNSDIVTDYNYSKSKRGGHPRDSASELFASSFMIYRLYPNEFLKRILDPNIKKETRRFGKSIFLYLRDRIFKGRFYSDSDPFRGEFLGEIKGREILNSLCLAAGNERSNSYARSIITSMHRVYTQQFSFKYSKINRNFLQKRILRIHKLNNKICIKSLFKALKSNKSYTRIAAAKAISYLELINERLSAFLIKILLNDNNPKVRAAAAETLGSLGRKNKDIRSVAPLIRALRDISPDVRKAAVMATAWLGFKDRRLVAPLINALNDTNYKVRAAAARTIGWLKIKDRRFDDPLIRALGDINPEVREAAARAIGNLGKKNKKFVKPLRQAMGDKNPRVRTAATRAIGKLGLREKKLITFLIKALSDKNSVVRMVAAMSLGEIGGKKVIPILKKRLTDPNEYVRKAIKKAIKEIEKREAGI